MMWMKHRSNGGGGGEVQVKKHVRNVYFVSLLITGYTRGGQHACHVSWVVVR